MRPSKRQRYLSRAQIYITTLLFTWLSMLSPTVNAQTLSVNFDTEPALLTQIQSLVNEVGAIPAAPSSPWLTVAVRDVRADGFDLALERSEVGGGSIVASEQIGYLAMETVAGGQFTDVGGNLIRFSSQRTGNTVVGWNNGCSTTDFPVAYSQSPMVFASNISHNGDNGGWLRRCSLSTTSVGLVVDEDIATDNERTHLPEAAAIVSFSEPFSAAFGTGADRWQLAGDAVTLVDTLRDQPVFTEVSFATPFTQPPVIFALATDQGGDPSALRIRNVSTTGFSIAQVEPSGNDGPHIAMDIHYLAVTPGNHRLPDGTEVVAGVVDVSSSQAAPGLNNDNQWASTEYQFEDPGQNEAPTARFTTNATSGPAPFSVQFDATSSTDDSGITQYAWDFGDGSGALRPDAIRVTHQYTAPGSYRATLTVSDAQGLSDVTNTTITVSNPDPVDEAPQARFSLSRNSGSAPLDIDFDASQSSDDLGISSIGWDFGDGNSASGVTASHVYRTPGNFTVTVTVTDTSGQTDTATQNVDVRGSDPNLITDVDAARFLTQASFGPTLESIAELKAIGYEAWLDRQFELSGPPHLEWVQRYYNGSNSYGRHEPWWVDAVEGPDQLRQRVAFALSQIFVVSDIGYVLSNNQYGVTNYYDMMRNSAFGNYRTLLEDVSLNPIMGLYLSMAKNEREDAARNVRPDENFAREVMQLFTIGINELNLDGSERLDGQGQPIPTYTQTDVEEFARVFTGWHFAGVDYWERTYYAQDMIRPMEPWAEYHDDGSKTLLGGEVIPAGLTATEDLDRALDNLFSHPNVGPFVSKQLIQRLVTSNPTGPYVRRVASVFNDNGNGERGDLKAVVKAILLDEEARSGHLNISHFGKVREPVIRLAHLFRAFNLTRGDQSQHGEFNTASPSLALINADTGQAVLKATSVFNFYHPDFAPVGPVKDAGLISPEFEIATENNVIATASRISGQIQYYYSTNIQNARNQSTLDLRREFALAADIDALLDHLNLLLLNGSMSTQMRGILQSHLSAISDDDEGRSQRARDAITLIMASPDYVVQR